MTTERDKLNIIVKRKEEGGKLEVGDDFGDVGVHLVQFGVLGGDLPVLAPCHRVHNVLGEERYM